MKMNAASVASTLKQFDAQAIPDDHPVCQQLKGMYGDHTYFIDSKGLNIVEPTEQNDAGETVCAVINIADWADNTQRSLMPHEPQQTAAVVVLEPGADTRH